MTRESYGSWRSPISSDRIAGGTLLLAQPRLDRGELYWLEGRPTEGGRQVVMRAAGGAAPVEVTPRDVNVRTRVHEYGGGDYAVRDGVVYFCCFADQRVYRAPVEGGTAEPLTRPGPRYADLEVSPDGRWLAAVEELPVDGGEPENRIVALSLARRGPVSVVSADADFASSPRFSPDGRRLAWTVWDHPQMPWDGTRLRLVDWGADGPACEPRQIAGGATESIFQPGFTPDGTLLFVSDRSGWWNLYACRDGRAAALCPREAEFGRPQWVFGLSTYACIDADTLLCCYAARGRDRLARLSLASGALEELDLPFTCFAGLRAEGGRACFAAASPTRAIRVCTLDLATGRVDEHRSSVAREIDPAWVSVPEAIEFPSAAGATAHAFLYRPANPEATPPPHERPPLLVKSHGGPTSSAIAVLDLRVQYWTSRGFAVLDVNYRGSSGYGRAYRELLRGAWGVADVEDCVAAARAAAGRGWADPARLCISGGSAGGYTTLCALTFHDTFSAGASHYGIGDLEALARDTHKFEARYLDGLVAPYPEGRALYRERSPIHFTERLACPVIFFQGLEDRVVPPSQAEAMVAALAARGIPHAYVPFPGEAHGFRAAESIRTALDGELYFYARVFGFDVDVRPHAVRIAGL